MGGPHRDLFRGHIQRPLLCIRAHSQNFVGEDSKSQYCRYPSQSRVFGGSESSLEMSGGSHSGADQPSRLGSASQLESRLLYECASLSNLQPTNLIQPHVRRMSPGRSFFLLLFCKSPLPLYSSASPIHTACI